MKWSEINLENKMKMLEGVKFGLERIGVFVDFPTINEKGDENNIRIVSTPFRTTPTLFRCIWVEGIIYIGECEKQKIEIGPDKGKELKVYNISVSLNCSYEHFDGGSNGLRLGRHDFVIIEDGVQNLRNLGLAIK